MRLGLQLPPLKAYSAAREPPVWLSSAESTVAAAGTLALCSGRPTRFHPCCTCQVEVPVGTVPVSVNEAARP
jgi:hypothetical protein